MDMNYRRIVIAAGVAAGVAAALYGATRGRNERREDYVYDPELRRPLDPSMLREELSIIARRPIKDDMTAWAKYGPA